MPKGKKLQDRFINVCRTRHLAISTEKEYWYWIRAFIRFHGIKTEGELLEEPERKFSDFISAESRRGVAASTQNQAWNALLFLYREVERVKLQTIPEARRATRPARLPDVPATHADSIKLIETVAGDVGLCVRLIYGSALRVSDALRIRRPITPHSLRHASAREMERRGSPISEIQKTLGHRDVETTMRYQPAGLAIQGLPPAR